MARKYNIKERTAWSNMKDRCLNDKYPSYSNYGGRGIKVCKRWIDSFDNFLEDIGTGPKGSSLDRRDNSKGYNPSNCRWVSNDVQQNNKRTNIVLEYNGKKMSVTQWSRNVGINRDIVSNRLRRGWPVGEALGFESRVNIKAPIYISYNGKRLNIPQWSERIGISSQALYLRLKRGWPIGEALGFIERHMCSSVGDRPKY